MITFIELWTANDNWKELSTEDRGAYLSKMQPSIPAFLNKGAKILGWGLNDKIEDYKGEYTYFAIWTFPDESLVLQFKTLLQDANWYYYFDQINIAGDTQGPEEVIGHMISN